MQNSSPFTRRQFLGRVLLAAGAVPALYGLPALTVADPTRAMHATIDAEPLAPVVSFHVDLPYLDKSGSAMPYVPPTGFRSAQAVSQLSDAEFLSRYAYF